MVTWGENTVHTFGGGTNNAGLFGGASTGTPAPAPGGAFGSPGASTGLFGSSTAPTSGGLFGSSPGSGQSSLFGNPAPAQSSLFGGAPAPAGGLFGAPTPSAFGSAPSLFGSPAPSAFGSAPNSGAVTQQQIPAQAALQAHMDASARQEAARVVSVMEGLHSAYTGTISSSKGDQDYKFKSIVYSELTPEQRQLQWLHGMGSGSSVPVAPPKPPQVTEEEWNKAVVRNPNPNDYMPIALVGAESLQARLSWQQDRANQLEKSIATLQSTQEWVRERCNQGRRSLEQINRTHASQRMRLLNVMRKVEVVRCMNMNLQPDEVKAMQQLMALEKGVSEVKNILAGLQDRARAQPVRPVEVAELPDKGQLFRVLKEHREEISNLTLKVQKDMRDVDLVRKRVTAPAQNQLR